MDYLNWKTKLTFFFTKDFWMSKMKDNYQKNFINSKLLGRKHGAIYYDFALICKRILHLPLWLKIKKI